MGYVVTNDMRKHLKEQFEQVVLLFLTELCRIWDIDEKDGWFVGDDVGDVWCYGDNLFINFDDMRYVVENNVSYDTYMEWLDYNVWVNNFGFDKINLRSWCHGCPRVDESARKRLTEMREELRKEIENVHSSMCK